MPFGAVVYDTEYIYVEKTIPLLEEYNDSNIIQRFYVFDNEYNLVAAKEIPYSTKRGLVSFYTVTDGQILFSSDGTSEGVDYYIDKAEIAEDLLWHEV